MPESVTENSGKTENLRPFKKGQSGNPGGRPKGLAAHIRKATKDGQELADFMLEVFRNQQGGRIPLPVRMDAAKWLADRGFGKAVQTTELTGPDGGPIQQDLNHRGGIEVRAVDYRVAAGPLAPDGGE